MGAVHRQYRTYLQPNAKLALIHQVVQNRQAKGAAHRQRPPLPFLRDIMTFSGYDSPLMPSDAVRYNTMSHTQNLTSTTVIELKRMIAESGLQVGELFATQAQLEKKFNVSGSVIRDAVGELRTLGVLKTRKSVGLLVGEPDPIALFEKAFEISTTQMMPLKDVAQLRYTLEIGSIDAAVKEATAEEIAQLADLAEQFADRAAHPSSEESHSVDSVDLAFHRMMLQCTHNDMIIRMHHVVTAYFGRISGEFNGWLANSVTDDHAIWQHRAIAAAFAKRNVEAARSLLALHLAGLADEVEHADNETS